MKTIHQINKWSLIVTLVLYLTIIFGMYSQIILGGIQILLALILTIRRKELDYNAINKIMIYWGMVFCYGTICLFDIWESIFMLIFITIIPMSIAGYFVHITYSIQKRNKLINNHSI